MKEQQHIRISIAGQTFTIDNPRESVDKLREIEHNINKIYGKWCLDFHNLSPDKVLAMVAFQYARYYYNLVDTVNENEVAITDFEHKLDQLLDSLK